MARVQRAVEKLGYRPNQAARQLKTGEASMIGLLVPSLGNPSYGVVAREIELAALDRYGYRVVVANTYRDPRHERAFIDDMAAQGVRGVIVISSLPDESHLEGPAARGMVAVSYDSHSRRDARPLLDYVSSDNVAGAKLAVEYLVELGHRTIALLTPARRTFSRAEKRDGFDAAIAASGVRGVVIEGEMTPGFADAEMAELGQSLAKPLLRHRAKPTAAIAINDIMAIGLIAGLRSEGLSLPDDMSIVGMDGIPLGAFTAPPLSTVKLPVPELARAMVDRIMLRLKHPETTPAEFRFAPSLLVRGSAAAPAKSKRS